MIKVLFTCKCGTIIKKSSVSSFICDYCERMYLKLYNQEKDKYEVFLLEKVWEGNK